MNKCANNSTVIRIIRYGKEIPPHLTKTDPLGFGTVRTGMRIGIPHVEQESIDTGTTHGTTSLRATSIGLGCKHRTPSFEHKVAGVDRRSVGVSWSNSSTQFDFDETRLFLFRKWREGWVAFATSRPVLGDCHRRCYRFLRSSRFFNASDCQRQR